MTADDRAQPDDLQADLQQPHRKAELPGRAGAKGDAALSTDEETSRRIPSHGVGADNDTPAAAGAAPPERTPDPRGGRP